MFEKILYPTDFSDLLTWSWESSKSFMPLRYLQFKQINANQHCSMRRRNIKGS
jgi:hypothetical protein